jgi:hypothetical protein
MLSKLRVALATLTTSTMEVGCGDDLPTIVVTTTSTTGTTSGNDDIGVDDDTAEVGGEPGDTTSSVADGTPCEFDEEIDGEYEFAGPPEAPETTLTRVSRFCVTRRQRRRECTAGGRLAAG